MKISTTQLIQGVASALFCSVAVAACSLMPTEVPAVGKGLPVYPGAQGPQGNPVGQARGGQQGGEPDMDVRGKKRRKDEMGQPDWDRGSYGGDDMSKQGSHGGEKDRGPNKDKDRGMQGSQSPQQGGLDVGVQGGEKDRGQHEGQGMGQQRAEKDHGQQHEGQGMGQQRAEKDHGQQHGGQNKEGRGGGKKQRG